MKKTKKIRRAIPIYLLGITWLVYGLIFPLYKTAHFLTVSLLSAVVFIVAYALIPARTIEIEVDEKFGKTGNKDTDELLSEGEKYLSKLREYNQKIYEPDMSRQVSRMIIAATGIFSEISKNPSKAPRIRRFMNYYVPTTIKILDAREKLASSGVKGENITKTLRSIEENMVLIASAFERQLDNLFEDEALDISTDIEVLEGMLASEGIITEDRRDSNG
ncbi:MAG: hypothetical protein GX633_06210 [Clostridiales bacterium]|nr:hypothetical protein [Clostridiales bacterium]